METEKISELDTLATADNNDILVINDVSEEDTMKITKQNLLKEVTQTINTHDSDISSLESNVGNLSSLMTTNKTSLVNAINEVYGHDKYSTNESVVGTWVDDKPIYRKVFTQANTNNISNVAPNNENIIRMECYIRRTGTNAWRSLPWLFVSSNTYGGASWAGGFYFNNNAINFQLGSELGTIDKLIFIIEYTKTID